MKIDFLALRIKDKNASFWGTKTDSLLMFAYGLREHIAMGTGSRFGTGIKGKKCRSSERSGAVAFTDRPVGLFRWRATASLYFSS